MNKLFTLLILLFFSLAACTEKTEEIHEGHDHSKVHSYFTCSMHPQVKEDKMGKCPICHMNLTLVEIEEGEEVAPVKEPPKPVWVCKNFPEVTSQKEDICPFDGTPMIKKKIESKAPQIVAKIKLRKAQLSHFKPDFFPVTSMKMDKKVRLLGSVKQSEEKESTIPARISGRVEKVYIKSTGSLIQVGDPVVDLYSPKLISAGEEYILAKTSYQKNSTKEFRTLLTQSEERLELWGIKPFQFRGWYKKGKVPRRITLFSPTTGIVRERNAAVGKYFKEGQNFFELSDLSEVWVEMDVYEQDSALVQIGQKLELEFASLPGEKVEGVIDFINPVLNANSRTLKVRTTVSNPSGRLKPGMVAEATLTLNLQGEPLVVPRSAIIDTGIRKVVWTKVAGKQYQAKTIDTGYETGGYVEVKRGLMEGEEVVVEGNFLLDAQAQLFGGYERMNTGK